MAEAREIYYRGRVQGVGFRYTTRGVAARFKVTGFVRNLPDGRVHMWAEGDPAELDRFISAVAQAMTGYIEESETSVHPGSGQHPGFEIRA